MALVIHMSTPLAVEPCSAHSLHFPGKTTPFHYRPASVCATSITLSVLFCVSAGPTKTGTLYHGATLSLDKVINLLQRTVPPQHQLWTLWEAWPFKNYHEALYCLYIDSSCD